MTGPYRDPPHGQRVTARDRALLSIYLRLIDAEAAGASWREAAAIILALDPDAPGSEAAWQRYRDRAHWLIRTGWTQLRAPAPESRFRVKP